MSPEERRRKLERLEKLAGQLDTRFKVLGVRVGWDSILGLIPGVGDIVTAAPAALMVVEGARLGARKRVLGRMAVNGIIDMAIGGIPLVGDIFDVFFKSHKRNIALLSAEVLRIEKTEIANRNSAPRRQTTLERKMQ